MKNSINKILSFVVIVAIAMASFSMVVFATEAPGVSAPAAATNATQQQQPNGMNPWIMILIYVIFFVVIGFFFISRRNFKRKFIKMEDNK